MASNSVAEKSGPQRTRRDNGRRGWSDREEEVLAEGMKKIIREGMKSENGFKTGYLKELELYMQRKIPGCTLKADPHINSRITVWKRNYNSLLEVLGNTDIGVDSVSKLVDATDEQWEAWIKKDPNARTIKNKKFPLYDAWCEIFGGTRATGEGAQDHNNAEKPPSHVDGDNETAPIDVDGMDEDESTIGGDQTGESSDARKKAVNRKRKSAPVHDPFMDVMQNFCNTTSARLGEIAQRIGHEQDMSNARRKIFEFVQTMDCLNRSEKLRVTHLISRSVENLDVFFSLPVDDHLEWTLMVLRGEV